MQTSYVKVWGWNGSLQPQDMLPSICSAISTSRALVEYSVPLCSHWKSHIIPKTNPKIAIGAHCLHQFILVQEHWIKFSHFEFHFQISIPIIKVIMPCPSAFNHTKSIKFTKCWMGIRNARRIFSTYSYKAFYPVKITVEALSNRAMRIPFTIMYTGTFHHKIINNFKPHSTKSHPLLIIWRQASSIQNNSQD